MALLAVVLVGVLLWKPWDRPSPAPSLGPIAGVPIRTPTDTPSSSPAPTLAPTAAPVPTLAPRTPSPTTSVVDVDVRYGGRGGAFVQCGYEPLVDGKRVLARLEVGPPYVEVNPVLAAAKNVRRVSWHAELELNALDTMFSADWTPIRSSRDQFASELSQVPLDLEAVSMRYDEPLVGPIAVVRVVVVVEWYGSRQMLGSREIIPASYGYDEVNVLSEGCHTFLN